jgi:hypothetical protein
MDNHPNPACKDQPAGISSVCHVFVAEASRSGRRHDRFK